jgi:peptidoglycan/xylan/chitin deacetylase (PgdA/CDA1 family)
MKTQKKWLLIGGSIAAVLLLLAVVAILILNKYTLELSVPNKKIVLEYGVDEVPAVKAIWRGTLWHRKGTQVDVTVDGNVDLKKLGEYPVIFSAEYKGVTLREERIFVVADTIPPEIKLVEIPNYVTNPALPYVEEGFSATDNYDGDLTAAVTSEQKGIKVIYTVTDSSGNKTIVERQLNYKDEIAPVISLTGGTSIALNPGKDFVDPGYTATDECDGDLTSSVKVEGSVNGHKYGTYTLTYSVSDSKGNKAEVKRTVRIADISAPVLTLQGETSTFIKVGTAYTDPGFSASDNIDGNLTTKVVVSGTVDTSKMARNVITYTVKDAFGNVTTKTRTVYVYEKQAVANTINPGNKVVYLTFDDGPSKYTARLLDILDKYGVKATFFVTNQFSKYQYMIGEAYRRGHQIALHTYSHNYASVYASEDAYYADLYKIRDVVVQQTGGYAPTIVRFPGGTSNTVSRKYCKGIMSTISKTLAYHGFYYSDWNVSSGDAGGANSISAVYNNVVSGIQKRSISIVLQHDITNHSVEAVDQIIFWGLSNGYTFLPMSETTPMVHFSPQN